MRAIVCYDVLYLLLSVWQYTMNSLGIAQFLGEKHEKAGNRLLDCDDVGCT